MQYLIEIETKIKTETLEDVLMRLERRIKALEEKIKKMENMSYTGSHSTSGS